MSGVKATAGPLEPPLAFRPCRGWSGRHVGLPRLRHFVRVPGAISLRPARRCGAVAWLRVMAGGFEAPGSFPPRPRPFCRFRHSRRGAWLYVPGLPRVQVPRLPAPAAVAGIRSSPWAGGGGLRFRLWCGLRPQRLPGVKAAGPLEPLLAFGFRRGWLSTRARVRLGRGGHLCQLLVDPAGPFPGLGELGGLGEGLADALLGMIDLAAGVAGVSEDGGLSVSHLGPECLNLAGALAAVPTVRPVRPVADRRGAGADVRHASH